MVLNKNTPQNLLKRPLHEHTVGLLSSSNGLFFEKDAQKALNQPYLLADYSIFPSLFHFLGATCLLKR